MRTLGHLLSNNEAWSNAIKKEDDLFFETLSKQQSPKYLWIGCSDSRIPSNNLVGLKPGEMFVHRNIANVVVHTDLNCLSVIQYAVEYLKVEHIIVTGHYGCGGVQASLGNQRLGLIDNWLRHLQDVHRKHEVMLEGVQNKDELTNRMCELNVIEQALNVCRTSTVQEAWDRGQSLCIHGWIYDLKDGLLQDLDMAITAPEEVEPIYRQSIERIAQKIG